MNKIIDLKVLNEKNIRIHFQDGDSKVIDFSPFIGKGISAQLLDPIFFAKVSIDNGGGIEWPNGFDFCPNFLKEYKVNEKELVV
jgi:hypothetical protein